MGLHTVVELVSRTVGWWVDEWDEMMVEQMAEMLDFPMVGM